MKRYKIAQKAGKKIRIIRKKRHLTQEEISAKVGIHVSTFGRIERGEINPSLQTLNKIAIALDIKIKDLL